MRISHPADKKEYNPDEPIGPNNVPPGFTYHSLAPTTDQMIKDIHGWLSEIMPAARIAVKMLNARETVMRRWRGTGGNGKHAA